MNSRSNAVALAPFTARSVTGPTTPSRSWILAAWTCNPTRCPSVSVTMWRLRPLTFLAASNPRGPP